MSGEGEFDEAYDLIVVGTGAGGMTAALRAHDEGQSVLLVEKSEQYGGSSAMSGGALWVPNNHLMGGTGISDSREDALAYLSACVDGRTPADRLETYIDQAPAMVEWLTRKTRARFVPLSLYPDYYPEKPGGRPGARSIEPAVMSARHLGPEFPNLRRSHPQQYMLGRMAMTAREAHVLISGGLKSWLLIFKIMLAYFLNIPARVKSRRDSRLTLGNALCGRLRWSLLDRSVPIWLSTSAKELIVEDGRVVGLVVEREGETKRLQARKGVLLAAGGFARNKSMREAHQRAPISDQWSAANPSNEGDAITMGQAVGAATDLLEEAWWTPVTLLPGKSYSWILVIEKSMPHSILVDEKGRRFTNESAPYIDVVNGMYGDHNGGEVCVPAWLIFDARYRKKYPCGPLPPGKVQPDNKISRKLREGFLNRGKTLEELAGKIGVDAAGLQATVERFNANALKGEDPDFGRGESLYDKYYADPSVKPNPALGTLEEGPFYAIQVWPGDLGTKGGLVTDDHGRVVSTEGEPIPGLYAIGNATASIMGHTYPGAGGTIGPAMTHGWLAAQHIARQ